MRLKDELKSVVLAVLHVTTDMWRAVVEEHCLENPNLVLQPAEISSVVTSLLRAVSQVFAAFILAFKFIYSYRLTTSLLMFMYTIRIMKTLTFVRTVPPCGG